jgi:DNA-binding GntR family transcriptional regulator
MTRTTPAETDTKTAKPSGRGKVQDRVLTSLRYGLMSGLFVPGQVFSLRKLAASLGTSPMPIRESLSRLVAANALEELPNRSVRVPRLNATSLSQLFEMRTLIEGVATRVACEKVTDKLLEKLERLNQSIIEAHGRGDMAEVLRANQKFHFAIYGHADSDIMMPLIESLWLRSGPTMYYSLNSPGLWDASSHVKILEAMAARAPENARAAMVEDILKTGDYLVEKASTRTNSGPFADLGMLAADDMT